MRSANPLEWTPEEVAQWLRSLGLPEAAEQVLKEKIDGTTMDGIVRDKDFDSLEMLGVTHKLRQRKIFANWEGPGGKKDKAEGAPASSGGSTPQFSFITPPPPQPDGRSPLDSLKDVRVDSLVACMAGVPIPGADAMAEDALVFARGVESERRLGLGLHFAAAINLYTQGRPDPEECLYYKLNEALYTKEGERIQPFMPFLSLFTRAMGKLPKFEGTVYRVVLGDQSDAMPPGRKLVWWGVSSCTRNLQALEEDSLLGGGAPRTLFQISVTAGVQLGAFSSFPDDDEVVLAPGAELEVEGVAKQDDGVVLVQLKQTAPGTLSSEPSLGFVSLEENKFVSLEDDDGTRPKRKTAPRTFGTLVQPEHSRHAHRIVYFDVQAKDHPLTLTAVYGGVSKPGPIAVYTRNGSSIGLAGQRTEWRKVGEGVFGEGRAHDVDLDEPVVVGAGRTVGVLVHCLNGLVRCSMPVDDSRGTTHKENHDLVVKYGGVQLQDHVFEGVKEGPVHMLAGGFRYYNDHEDDHEQEGAVVEQHKRIDTEMRPENAGHSHRAVYFDVQAKGKPVKITSIFGGIMEAGPITVYACIGGGLNHASSPHMWKKVGEGEFQRRKTTELKLFEPVAVAANARVGIYVHCRGGRLQYNHPHKGSKGGVHRENEDVKLINGGCHLQDEPFVSPRDGPLHIIAGGVGYSVGGGGKVAQEQMTIFKRVDTRVTPENSGHSHHSVFFDVRAKERPITIKSLFGGQRQPGNISVYYVVGSGINRAQSPSGWVLVGKGTFRTQRTTELKLDTPVEVPAFGTVGIYVHCTGHVQYDRSNQGSKGEVHSENEDAALIFGGCHLQTEAFVNANVGPMHILAGGVGYSITVSKEEFDLGIPMRINTLMSPEESGHSHHSVWFDVRAKAKQVTLVSLFGGIQQPGDVTVYSCLGSGLDRATDPGAWKKVGSGTFRKARTTELRLSTPIVLPPFGTVGIYVHCTGHIQYDKSDQGNKGDIHVENNELQLVFGGCHLQSEAFVNPSNGPMHILAGGVGYMLGGSALVEKTKAVIKTKMTPEESSNSHRSVWFDVVSKGQPLTISSLFGGVRVPGSITIFVCEGSGIDLASDPNKWKKVGEGTFQERKTSEIKLTTPIQVPPGGTVGIYVHCHGGRVQYDRANQGSKGQVHVENDEVQLVYGGCHLQEDPFVNPNVGPMHILAGAVGYSAGLAVVGGGLPKRIDTKMTPEDSSNSHRSVWFDVKSRGPPLVLTSLFGGVRAPGPITIYYCIGSGIDRASEAAIWKLVGEGTFQERRTSEIKFKTPVTVPPGGIVGIYVHCHGGRVQYDRANEGTKGHVHSENEDVQLIYGGCHLQDDPFVNPNVGPMHILAGGVGYLIGNAKPVKPKKGVPKRFDALTQPDQSLHAHRAVWFDVKAKLKPILVTSIFGGVSDPGPVTVYASKASGLDKANKASAWEVVGRGEFDERRATELRLHSPVIVSPNTSIGFYVHCDGGRVQFSPPHQGRCGDVHAENSEVVLVYGGSHLQDSPFANAREGPVFMIAGGVGYETEGKPPGPPRVLSMSTRPEDAHHSHRAVWFDVRANEKAVTVVSISGGVVDPGPVTVYSCSGPGIYSATNPSVWTVVGRGTFRVRRTSELMLSTPVRIPPFTAAGFYVHCRGGRVQFNPPLEGNRGEVHCEDENVSIAYGGCHRQDQPFVNPSEGPVHMLAGSVSYVLDPDADDDGAPGQR